MKRYSPIKIILYSPKADVGKHELAKRVAQIHADAVIPVAAYSILFCTVLKNRTLSSALAE